MGDMKLQSESESEELSLAAAAPEEPYAEQDEWIEPGKTAALVLARRGVTLGEVFATHPAFEPMTERAALAAREVTARVAETIGGAALNVLERTGQQVLNTLHANTSSVLLGVARGIGQQPLIEFPQLRVAASGVESVARGVAISDGLNIYRDAAESLRLRSGINAINAVSAWEDRLVPIVEAWQEQEQRLLSISNFARTYAAEQAAISKRMNEQLAEWRDAHRAEQQQRQEAMMAVFADMGRWQAPNILWREAVPHQWGVYEPEPEPTAEETALEVVHLQGDWQAALTAMIHDGKVSPAELIKLALAHGERARPGQKLPPLEEIEAICLDYERNKRRWPNQEMFARRHGISKATFTRYRQIWRLAQKRM